MRRLANARGAMLIQVGISILMLMGFTVFVIDYGVLWSARTQAQSAADAGALAGIIARKWDDTIRPPGTPDTNGLAWTSAVLAANANPIWGAPGVARPSWTCPPEWDGYKCARMDVYRNGEFGSARMGTYFGPLFNLAEQGVRATATAVVASGGTVKCLKPWIVPDRWPAGDINAYVPPYSEFHTGYNLEDDLGVQLVLKEGDPGSLSSGWTGTLDLPDPPGTPPYRTNISGCNPTVVGIAPEAQNCTAIDYLNGCVGVQTGVQQGQTVLGIDDLVYQEGVYDDRDGYWDTNLDKPAGGCTLARNCPNGVSPRLVPIALFDPKIYTNSGCTGGTCITKVVNIIGFYIEGICSDLRAANRLDAGNDCGTPSQENKAVVGRLVEATALGFGTPVEESAAFLQFIVLVR
jgi:hypothetical protein